MTKAEKNKVLNRISEVLRSFDHALPFVRLPVAPPEPQTQRRHDDQDQKIASVS